MPSRRLIPRVTTDPNQPAAPSTVSQSQVQHLSLTLSSMRDGRGAAPPPPSEGPPRRTMGGSGVGGGPPRSAAPVPNYNTYGQQPQPQPPSNAPPHQSSRPSPHHTPQSSPYHDRPGPPPPSATAHENVNIRHYNTTAYPSNGASGGGPQDGGGPYNRSSAGGSPAPGGRGNSIPSASHTNSGGDPPSSPQGPPALRAGRYTYMPSSPSMGPNMPNQYAPPQQQQQQHQQHQPPQSQNNGNDGYADFNRARSLSSSGSRSPSSYPRPPNTNPQGMRDNDMRQPQQQPQQQQHAPQQQQQQQQRPPPQDHYSRRSPPHDSPATRSPYSRQPHPQQPQQLRHPADEWREHSNRQQHNNNNNPPPHGVPVYENGGHYNNNNNNSNNTPRSKPDRNPQQPPHDPQQEYSRHFIPPYDDSHHHHHHHHRGNGPPPQIQRQHAPPQHGGAGSKNHPFHQQQHPQQQHPQQQQQQLRDRHPQPPSSSYSPDHNKHQQLQLRHSGSSDPSIGSSTPYRQAVSRDESISIAHDISASTSNDSKIRLTTSDLTEEQNVPHQQQDTIESRTPPTTTNSRSNPNNNPIVTNLNSVGCTCKKSKCLKLYCQCFASELYCATNCRCLSCHNTHQHGQERRDAINGILARNPTAFDTKFKRITSTAAYVAVGGTVGVDEKGNPQQNQQQPKVAHKLGCKCRKSACLKKYCECYHADVKCSANCRCVGCLNVPPRWSGPVVPPGAVGVLVGQMNDERKRSKSFTPTRGGSSGSVPVQMVKTPTRSVPTTPPLQARPTNATTAPPATRNGSRCGNETWMMDAAQNLACLKNASPMRSDSMTSLQRGHGHEITPVPSLTASDAASKDDEYSQSGTGTYGDEIRERPSSELSSTLPSTTNTTTNDSSSAVNALLMAAVAMTELGSSSRSTPSSPATTYRQPATTTTETSGTVRSMSLPPSSLPSSKQEEPKEEQQQYQGAIDMRSPKRKSRSCTTNFTAGSGRESMHESSVMRTPTRWHQHHHPQPPSTTPQSSHQHHHYERFYQNTIEEGVSSSSSPSSSMLDNSIKRSPIKRSRMMNENMGNNNHGSDNNNNVNYSGGPGNGGPNKIKSMEDKSSLSVISTIPHHTVDTDHTGPITPMTAGCNAFRQMDMNKDSVREKLGIDMECEVAGKVI